MKNNLRLFWIACLCVFFLFFIPMQVSATETVTSGTVGDNLTWILDSDGVLTVSGEGVIQDFESEESTPWWNYRGQVRKIVISDGITHIGKYAFYGLYNAAEVVIGNDVETIGILAFSNINTVTKLTVGTGLKSVGSMAFNGWVRLKEVHITDLSMWCKVNFSDGPPSGWAGYVENCCLYLNGEKVTQVTIPEDVTAIGKGVLCYDGITSVTVHDAVTSIGAAAFANDITDIYYTGTLSQWLKINCTGAVCSKGANLHIDGQLVTSIVIPDDATSVGDYAFANFGGINSVTLPETVTNIGVGAFMNSPVTNVEFSDRITSIGKDAFMYCTGLNEISLPVDLEVIGTYAFFGCTGLSCVEMKEGLVTIDSNAFQGCSSLMNITLPTTLKTIGEYAFYECDSISEIYFPSGIENLGQLSFSGSEALTRVEFEGGNYSIGDYAFSSCKNLADLVFGEGLTAIGYRSFAYCVGITEIVLPASLTQIGDYGFSECSSLSSITFLGNAPLMGRYPFESIRATCYYPADNDTYTHEFLTGYYGGTLYWEEEGFVASNYCGDDITWELTEEGTLILSGSGTMYDYDIDNVIYTPWYEDRTSVKAVNINEGITYIGNDAFSGCSSATQIALPSTVTVIGSKAFYSCAITNIDLPESLSEVGDYAFSNTLLTSVKIPGSIRDIPCGMFSYCSSLQDVTLSSGLRAIGDSAFARCYELRDIVLPEGVVSLGAHVFEGCGASSLYGEWYDANNFTAITLPSSLESIGEYAFNYCESLKNIQIPEKVTVLRKGTFSRCWGLTRITIPANIVSIEKDAFIYCKNLRMVTFQWTAPAFAEEIFYQVTATCYYPSNNPAWTADLLQNYDGTLTWIGQEMEEPEEGSGGGSGENAGEEEGDKSDVSGGNGDNETEGGDTGSGETRIDITIDNSGASSSVVAPINGWVEGTNTFLVSSETPCAVFASYDGGENYTRLEATEVAEGYSFTAEEMTAETILAVAVLGDANGDGRFTNADVTRIRAAYAGKIVLDAVWLQACDVNGDGSFTNADVTMIRAAYAEKITLKW